MIYIHLKWFIRNSIRPFNVTLKAQRIDTMVLVVGCVFVRFVHSHLMQADVCVQVQISAKLNKARRTEQKCCKMTTNSLWNLKLMQRIFLMRRLAKHFGPILPSLNGIAVDLNTQNLVLFI